MERKLLSYEEFVAKQESVKKLNKNKAARTIEYLECENYLKDLTGNIRIRKKDVYEMLYNNYLMENSEIRNIRIQRSTEWNKLELELKKDKELNKYSKSSTTNELSKLFINWITNATEKDKEDFLNNKNNNYNDYFITRSIPQLIKKCTVINNKLFEQFRFTLTNETITVGNKNYYVIESDYLCFADFYQAYSNLIKKNIKLEGSINHMMEEITRQIYYMDKGLKSTMVRKAKLNRFTRQKSKNGEVIEERKIINVEFIELDDVINTLSMDNDNELKLYVREFIPTLSKTEQEIIKYNYNGYSPDDISNKLNINKKTLKTLKSRIKNKWNLYINANK